MPNPYLQQSANDIATNLTQNWQQNALPAINSGAMLAGGFGGSRQGVAQGISANGLNQAIGQAQTSLYGQAYDQDQNRSNQMAMQQAQLAAQERMASQSNQTQRDLGFGNLGLGYTQAGNQFALGMGNLGLGNKQADQSFALGVGNLGNQQQQTANQYTLGLGNLGLGFTQANNQYALGQQQNANTAQANQNQYTLGLGSLGNQRYGMDQNYGLGLGQLGLQSRTADQNFYTNQRGQDLTQMGLGAQLANQGNLGLSNQGQQLFANGQAQQQAPWQQLGNFSNIAGQYSGLNQTDTRSTPGPSTFGSAAGGAITLAQLWKLLNPGN